MPVPSPPAGSRVTSRPCAWRRGAGSARRGHRCRPASACRCRTGGTRSRARRAGRPSSTACRTGCRTSNARWQACNRGGFLPSFSFQSREAGQARADTPRVETPSPARQSGSLARAARRDRGSCCSAAPSSSPSTTGSGSAAPGLDRLRQWTSVRRGRGQRRPRLPAQSPRAPGASAAPGWRSRRRSSAGAPRRSTGPRSSSTTPRPPTRRRPTSATWPSTRWRRPGSILLVRARARELDWRLWMDGLIAGLGTAALGAALVFEFVADRDQRHAVQVATTLAYPLGDILMLALVVGVVALTRWRPGRTWSLLLARPGGAGRRRRRLHAADDRRQPARRRLDRTDLPARRRLHRRRGLADPGRHDPADGPLRRLARADGPGLLRDGDDRPLRHAVLQPRQRPDHGALGGDDDRRDRPARR